MKTKAPEAQHTGIAESPGKTDKQFTGAWDGKGKALAEVGKDSLSLNQKVEAALIGGDMTPLSTADRVLYYKATCESLGLNPLTKPFDYVVLNGKLQFYANKNCAEQLRRVHSVSITDLKSGMAGDVLTVVAKAVNGKGRADVSTGAVPFGTNIKGAEKANAIMKAETKAKRRVTLSLCGLGMLDDTEIDSIPEAKRVSENWQPEVKVEPDKGGLLPPGAPDVGVQPEEVERTPEPEISDTEKQERVQLIQKILKVQQTWDPESWEGFKKKTLGDDANGKTMNVDQLRKLWAALEETDEPKALEPETPVATDVGKQLDTEMKRVGWDAFTACFREHVGQKSLDDMTEDDQKNLLTALKNEPDSIAHAGAKKAEESRP